MPPATPIHQDLTRRLKDSWLSVDALYMHNLDDAFFSGCHYRATDHYCAACNRSIPAFLSNCCNVHDGAQLLIYDLLVCLNVPAHISWASMTAHSAGATFLATFIILLTWCLWSNKATRIASFSINAESGHATKNAHWWRRRGPNRPHVT